MKPSDEELISRIKAGDEAAFNILFARYRQPVAKHLGKIVRNATAISDVLQEVFMQVWTRAKQFSGKGTVKSWLYRIATNLAINHLRAINRRRQHFPELADQSGKHPQFADKSTPDPAAQLELSEQKMLLNQIINDMSENKRSVVHLIYEKELDIAGAAEYLKIPEGTVKSRLHYAIKEIAESWRNFENG